MQCNKACDPLLWGQASKKLCHLSRQEAVRSLVKRFKRPLRLLVCFWLLVAAPHPLRPQAVEELPDIRTQFSPEFPQEVGLCLCVCKRGEGEQAHYHPSISWEKSLEQVDGLLLGTLGERSCIGNRALGCKLWCVCWGVGR